MIEWALLRLLKITFNCNVFLGECIFTQFYPHFWDRSFCCNMPMKFEHDRMKNGWEVCKKRSIFQKNCFMKILWPQNPFLKTYMFGQGYSAHVYKIWAWSDAKWKSILRKTVIFTENKFFWTPKPVFENLCFWARSFCTCL